ncbi:MAG: flagellar basal-body rod protein FlgG [Candidatus Latescibacteria bacterium]|nr:flagellar basal-body rod protein FlgG [Candidatus Latescibacterota bacterium]MCK5526390.1 flagellar basal-body rod protein FlgG [Candidatus Latescibacterota bacterium]
MSRAMRTAATGMMAQQLNVDTIANNLANVNTTGFKRSKIEFQDLLYQTVRRSGISGAEAPVELQIGYGVRPVATQRIFSQGDITQTNNPLDLSIEGDGFFQIMRPDGTVCYTRDGTFKLSADGEIVTSDGFALEPELSLPEDTTDIHITRDGVLSVLAAGETEAQEIGQIELAKFINPAGLNALGRNLFAATEASGDAMVGVPGEEGFGMLSQGYLELSNVEVVEEMVNMIIAQRAYEISAKAVQTAEDMSSMANNLRR